MRHRSYTHYKVIVLAITCFSTLAFSISLWLLYQTSHEQQLRDAARTAETLGQFIEAVAQFDKKFSVNDNPGGPTGATMRQIEQSIANTPIAPGDMELLIGQRIGSNIRLLRKAERGLDTVIEVPDDGKLAVPLHLALQGKAGSGEYLDYRGVLVLAGYAPVPSLGIGVVYKADVDEVRAPFYIAGAWAGGILILMVLVFSIGFNIFSQRMQKRLADSERRFTSIINITPVGIFETNSDGMCFFVNERWSEITGLSLKEAEGTGWTNALHPEDRDKVFKAWQDFVSGTESFTLEFRILQRNGKIAWVLVRAIALKDDSDQVIGFTGAMTDITSIYHAEQQLLLKDAAIEHALNALAIADLEGKLTYVNSAFLRLWGHASIDDVIGRNVVEFWVLPQQAAGVLSELQQHGQWAGELDDALRADGQTFIVEMMAVLINDNTGQLQHMLASFLDITERKQAEEALRDSEAKYRSVIASMSEGVVVQQANGEITSCNAAAEDILGLSFDQMRGRTAMDPRWQAVKEDDSPFPGDQHPGTVALHTGESFNEVIMGVDHPAKGRRWVSINAHPLLMSDTNTPYGSVASFTDITEHRQHEAQINASNQILNAVLDTTPVLIAYLDREMNFIRVNETYASNDGKSSDYFPGKNYFALFPNAENEAIFHQVLATGKPHVTEAKPFEYQQNSARGVTHWDWTLTPIKDANGEVTGLVLSLMNVTEHIEALEVAKNSQQALQALNASLEQHVAERTRELNEVGDLNRQMISVSSFGISAYRADGICVFANAAISEMIGASHEQVMAQNFRDIASWKKYGITDLAQQVLESGQPKHQEFFTESSFDRQVWLGINFSSFQRDGANHLLLIVHDISARKQTEQLMLDAKDVAEKASKAKSEFLSRMSHELRTPMNAILGFSQVLELEPIDVQSMGFVHEIHQAGNHLLELINDLLDLSRIETGKMVTVIENVNIDNVINDAIKLVHSSASKKHIELNNQCNASVNILADATRLRQVLINLLSNAVKYSPDGGQIEISCRAVENERIRLSITDTGPGITPENIDSLFIPFERLDAKYSEVDGSGIGLALSKLLIELMGGDIGVISQPGQGSTFWIEITQASFSEDKAIDADFDAKSTLPYKALYIEDNAANLHLVDAIFKRHSQATLLTANNGEHGLELAKRYKPDVILLDIHLPDMDGYQVLAELRLDPVTQAIPVLALSADAMPIDIEKGLAAGFDWYLTKPVVVDELLKVLDKVLNEKPAI